VFLAALFVVWIPYMISCIGHQWPVNVCCFAIGAAVRPLPSSPKVRSVLCTLVALLVAGWFFSLGCGISVPACQANAGKYAFWALAQQSWAGAAAAASGWVATKRSCCSRQPTKWLLGEWHQC